MQVLVVDDELLARDRVKRLIEGLEGYQVAGEAENGEDCLAAIQSLDPDVVLLDISMPGDDGITTAKRIAQLEQPPAVIFCTAFNEYAVEAFETLAVGYILKPVKTEQLMGALEKARRFNRLQRQVTAGANDGSHRRKNIAAKTRRGVELIPVDDVFCFVADQKYVTVLHKTGETLIDDTLKDLEKEFEGQFVRVHRNALVAVSFIEKLVRTSSGQYELKLRDQNFRPTVSRRHVSAVRDLLGNL